VRFDIDNRHNIRILLVHVEQIHRVRRLMAIEDALLDHNHLVPVAAAVHH